VAGAILLLGVCALAESTAVRSGGVLRERIHPADWEISFQYPLAFVPADNEPRQLTEQESVLTYRLKEDRGAAAIAIYRIEVPPGTTAAHICAQMFARLSADPSRIPGLAAGHVPKVVNTRVGALDAIEVSDWELGIAVRATIVAHGLGYAVTLTTDPPHADPKLYALFDLTCRSIEYDRPVIGPTGD